MANRFQLEGFLPFRLNVVAQEVSAQLSAIYAERFGLDIPQWRILANLATRGDMTAQDIARIAFLHKSTISRAVAELSVRGLIKRLPSAQDKRAFLMRLTPAGDKVIGQLMPLVLQFEEHLLAGLKSTEREGLLRGLAGLERSLRVAEESDP
jgi:DNA-binding MarR family transcriptional regulator